MARYELFELPKRAALGDFEPCLFVIWRRHPRELTRGRPAEPSVAKSCREPRQFLEGLRHTQSLLRRSTCMPQHAFDIFAERTESEVQMRVRPEGVEQQPPLFPIESCPRSRQVRQRLVCPMPGGLFSRCWLKC